MRTDNGNPICFSSFRVSTVAVCLICLSVALPFGASGSTIQVTSASDICKALSTTTASSPRNDDVLTMNVLNTFDATTAMSCNVSGSVVVRCSGASGVACHDHDGCFSIPSGVRAIHVWLDGCTFVGGPIVTAFDCPDCNLTITNVVADGQVWVPDALQTYSNYLMGLDDFEPTILVNFEGSGSTLLVQNSSFRNATQGFLVRRCTLAQFVHVNISYMYGVGTENTTAMDVRHVDRIDVDWLNIQNSNNCLSKKSNVDTEIGGCSVLRGSFVVVNHSQYQNCHSRATGGCLGLTVAGTTRVENVKMTQCEAELSGGALYVSVNTPQDRLFLSHITISNTSAIYLSSGIYVKFQVDTLLSSIYIDDVEITHGVTKTESQSNSKEIGCFAMSRMCTACVQDTPNIAFVRNVRISFCGDKTKNGVIQEAMFRFINKGPFNVDSWRNVSHTITEPVTRSQTLSGKINSYNTTNQNMTKNNQTTTTTSPSIQGTAQASKIMTLFTYVLHGQDSGVGGLSQSTAALSLLVAQTSRNCDQIDQQQQEEDIEDGDDIGYLHLCISGMSTKQQNDQCSSKGSANRKAGAVVLSCSLMIALPIVVVAWALKKKTDLAEVRQPSKVMWWISYWSEASMVAGSHMAQRTPASASGLYYALTLVGSCLGGPAAAYFIYFGSVCFVSQSYRDHTLSPQNRLALMFCGSQLDRTKVCMNQRGSVWTLVFVAMSHIVLCFLTTAPMNRSSSRCRTHGILVAVVHGVTCLLYVIVRPFVKTVENAVCCVCCGLCCIAVVVSLLGYVEGGVGIILAQTVIRLVYGVWKRALWLNRKCSKTHNKE